MATPFIYNPSKGIEESLAGAAKGVEDIFQRQIQEKNQQYEYIKSVNENIDEISEKFNEYHANILSEEANAVLDDMRNRIYEGKKLTYKDQAELTSKVRKLTNLTNDSNRKTEALNGAIKGVMDNPSMFYNPTQTINEIFEKMSDKEVLFSPKGVSSIVRDIYGRGTNYQKLVTERINTSLTNPEVSGRLLEKPIAYIDDQGNEVTGTVKYYENLHDVDSMGNITIKPSVISDMSKGGLGGVLNEEEMKYGSEQIIGKGKMIGMSEADAMSMMIEGIGSQLASKSTKVAKTKRQIDLEERKQKVDEDRIAEAIANNQRRHQEAMARIGVSSQANQISRDKYNQDVAEYKSDVIADYQKIGIPVKGFKQDNTPILGEFDQKMYDRYNTSQTTGFGLPPTPEKSPVIEGEPDENL
jgi:hypothetical protein